MGGKDGLTCVGVSLHAAGAGDLADPLPVPAVLKRRWGWKVTFGRISKAW